MTHTPTRTTAVLGVDACARGWAGVVLLTGEPDAVDGPAVVGVFATSLAALAAQAGDMADVTVVAVDMPIGLPDAGRRQADVLARRMVGVRGSSVFSTPVRAALESDTHAAASARNRELAGEGISQQAFGLGVKLLEVDRWLPSAGCAVVEVHPEVSFTVLASQPSAHSKKTWTGAAQRRALLASAGISLPDDLGEVGHQAAVDDVLDAAVAAWTARRYAAGAAHCYPDPPEIFSDGHPSAIWA